MIRSLFTLAVMTAPAVAASPTVLLSGVKNPTGVAVSADGRTFVATLGAPRVNGDGTVMLVKDGKAELFASGLDDPTALVAFQTSLFVADRASIRRIDLKTGKATVWADAKDFPDPKTHLTSLAADEKGTLYAGDLDRGVIYRVAAIPKGKDKEPDRKVTVAADAKSHPGLPNPSALAVDSLNHLLVLSEEKGTIVRVAVPGGAVEPVASGFFGATAITFDAFGRLYVGNFADKTIKSVARPGEKAVAVAETVAPFGLAYEPNTGRLIATNTLGEGSVVAVAAQPAGYEVDESPLKLETEVAFKDLTWTGWDSGADTGKVNPLRPIVLTHAGDGSNRIFVATQHGVIHSFKDEAGPRATNVFLDIQSKVLYKDNENEQGLLGLAFHPKYKSNGEIFVFYTDKSKRLQNVISRFRVSKTDPNKVDPNSEEELLRVSHKFWNHDGGTVCFGPDGMLYIVLGDGGSANDPDQNGQNKGTLLGKILRIDVDRKDAGLAYAIPKDNPFVNEKDAKPEIYCLGVRNPWRMAFDRKTGQGWFGEVGQNLWEEINLIEKGGNYGWSVRESLHPFGPKGTGPQPGMIEPVWEYHHSVGKSITGGHVYRGTKLPELDGLYLYADYVSGKLWALKYDFDKKRVVANRPIKDVGSPILSYGEDESGEVYLMTFSASGKGISRFVRSK